MKEISILGAGRTPIGGFQGVLSPLSAPELGGAAIKAALDNAKYKPDKIDEVLMGCVLSAGQGQAPARQAVFLGNLDENTPAVTVNKMCGSGMRTVMMASDQIKAGSANYIVAGGMESMTNAPYLLPKMRSGARIGHQNVQDSMFLDGLEDAYDKGRLMGKFAEDCAERYKFSRDAQDEYALRSLDRALTASKGIFKDEIAPLTIKTRKGEITVAIDEQPQNARPEKITQLKPAFSKDGTITAANSSSISDGAAALVLARGGHPDTRAIIRGYKTYAHAPSWFTTAPISAAQRLLKDIEWDTKDVDLWEVNEAFAVVPMAFMQEMHLSPEIVNIHGGACALGHPIGSSGARIIVTLINALEVCGLKRGVAAICIGGGEATAIAIELA